MTVASDALRVSDADRERVAAALLRAHGEGRLTLTEFDERVAAAHAAVVHADLVPLTADLPAGDVVTGDPTVGDLSAGDPSAPALCTSRPAARRPRSCGPFGGLPRGGLPVGGSPVGGFPAGGPGGGSLRVAVAVWAVVSAVNLLIWVAVVAGAGAGVHPWWFWVAGPWGVVLAVRAVGERIARPVSPSP